MSSEHNLDDKPCEDLKGRGRVICGAKTRDGGECKCPPMKGRTRCKYHGGKMPHGFDTKKTTHGRYSKFLPKRLLERYEASEGDPDLLNMRSEISLIDARLEDLLRRVDKGESGEAWSNIRMHYEELKFAFDSSDAGGVAAAMKALERTIMRAQSDYGTWRELQVCLEQRRRLVDSEGKRLQMMQQFITAEQAMLFVTTVMGSVTRNVRDTDILEAISKDIMALVGPGSRQFSLVEPD
jgi:hypothetical protein